MAKYILKQEAISVLANEAKTHNNPVKRAYARAAALIEQITAEDVQPVKHGKWLPKIEDIYEFSECSECGNMESCETPYCAQCGARMLED